MIRRIFILYCRIFLHQFSAIVYLACLPRLRRVTIVPAAAAAKNSSHNPTRDSSPVLAEAVLLDPLPEDEPELLPPLPSEDDVSLLPPASGLLICSSPFTSDLDVLVMVMVPVVSFSSRETAPSPPTA